MQRIKGSPSGIDAIYKYTIYFLTEVRCCLHQLMLDLAWVVFEQQTSVAGLIRKIMLHTQSLLTCQRCQVLLVDNTQQVCRSAVFLSH